MERYWELKDVLSPAGIINNLLRIVDGYDDTEFMRLEMMALHKMFDDLYGSRLAVGALLQAITFMRGQRTCQDRSIHNLLEDFVNWERSTEGCQRFWCRIGHKECCCGDPVIGCHEMPWSMGTSYPG